MIYLAGEARIIQANGDEVTFDMNNEEEYEEIDF